MEKIMVIVLDDEAKAYQGLRTLKRLDAEGSISIYAGALIRKNEDGTVTVPQTAMEDFPIRTFSGTAIGALIGLLGGPVGAAVGAGAGALVGLAGDVAGSTVDNDFLKEVAAQLSPGKVAVVLDVSEEWTTPVDTELESISSSILRRAKVDVEDEILARRIAANRRELELLEQERSHVREERKAKIQAKIDMLQERIRKQVVQLSERKDQIRDENKAKIQTIQERISTSLSENKRKLQTQLADIQKADMEFSHRIESSIAGGLRKFADRIERPTT